MNDQNVSTGMPGMPGMPVVSENTPSLSEGMSGEGVTSSTPVLDAPSHETKVIIESPEETITSNVDIPVVTNMGIKVIATREGFFGQQRLKEGSSFTVKKFENLGEWMKCEDAVIERKRVEFFKKKKAKK